MVHEVRLKLFGQDVAALADKLELSVEEFERIEKGYVTPTIVFMTTFAQVTGTDVQTNYLAAMAVNYSAIWNGGPIAYGKLMLKLASRLAIDLGSDLRTLDYEKLADAMLAEAARQQGKAIDDYRKKVS